MTLPEIGGGSIPKGDAGSLNSFVSVVAISAINGKNMALSRDRYDSQGGLWLGYSNHKKILHPLHLK